MASETRTGGRAATRAVIGGGLAIAVGRPQVAPPPGFAWRALGDLARLETGHTPSRRHPEYWDGDIPWIGIRDATGNHGKTIDRTLQTVTQAGIDNSSARVLPEGTVCLSRTASVGYVVVMGRPMATSQDFVNWVCGPDLDSRYLKYVLQSDRDALLRFANGSTHQTIYFPEAKAFHALLPRIDVQREIAATLGALDDKIESNHRQIALANALADELWQGITRASLSSCSIDDLAAAGTLLLSDGYRTRVDQLGTPGVPILRVADVSDDHFAVRPDADHILDTYRSRFSEKISVAGDVVVTTKGTVGRTALVGPEDVAAVYSPQLCFIRSLDRDALPPAALHRWVRSESFRAQARQVQDQTDMAAYISLADFRRFRLPLVDTRAAELSEIATIDALIAARRQETSALQAARDALLPELLSGRIRVPEPLTAVDGLS